MTSDGHNGTELNHIKSSDGEKNGEKNGDTQEKPETADTVVAEQKKSVFSFLTVEPFLLCYVLPTVILGTAVQNFNYEKACRLELNYTEAICKDVIEGVSEDNTTLTASAEAQVLVTEMISWVTPIQSGIPAIIILFVGAWSDKTGNRKALMLSPIFGEIIASLGLVLSSYYFMEIPLWVTGLIQALPTAFSGGLSVLLMGSYSFIADVTTLESRTFRVGIVGVIVTLGIPIGTAISGVLTKSLGYYSIFWIGAGLYAFGFTYAYFRIHDVKRIPMEGTFADKFKEFFNPMNAWNTISLVFLTRGRELLNICLVIWAHIVVMGPVFGEAPLLYYYMSTKFQMDIVDYSLFSTYSILMGMAGTTIAVTVFSKFLHMHDALIGVIATTSKVLGTAFYGLAPNRSWFYAAPALDIFGNSGTSVVRSLGTKVVKPENVGKMCSLIGFVEALVPVIYTPLYAKLYANTLTTLPGAYYLVGSAMTIPAVIIFAFLYVMHRRQQRDVVKNPDAKEMHAHENAVTVL